MAALYVTSLAEGGGKTAVCAGLARHLADDGKKVGFLKPITQGDVDSDALLMKDLLSLDEAPVKMCPVVGDAGESSAVVKQAYGQVSEGKDVVIVEGASEANEVARDMAELLDARVIIVGGPIELTQNTAVVCELFGERLLGVVVNKVPAGMDLDLILTHLEGLPVLGTLSLDPAIAQADFEGRSPFTGEHSQQAEIRAVLDSL